MKTHSCPNGGFSPLSQNMTRSSENTIIKSSKLYLKRLNNFIWSKKSHALAIPIVLTVLMILSAYPMFVGYAETYSYNGSNQSGQGFYIPQCYTQARNFLLDNSNSSILLLPPTTSNPYITTSWGFSGQIAFYQNFFAPLRIITLNNFGGTYSNATQQAEYSELTEPKFSNYSTNYTSELQNYVSILHKYGIQYLLVDSSITSGIAESVSQSYLLVRELATSNFATVVFKKGFLTIASINRDGEGSNGTFETRYSIQNLTSTLQIYSFNQNATDYQTQGVADVGNIVTFSVPGYNGTVPPIWSENSTYVGQSRYQNLTFPLPGLFQISAKFPNGTILYMNYTVNKDIVPFIIIPKVVESGTTVYLTGGVSGGTTFPGAGYYWEWYINGIYQKNIGDTNYEIPIIFNNTGSYNVTLSVHDALGENGTISVLVSVLNPTVYSIEEVFESNLTPGSVFYFAIFILAIFEAVSYKRSSKMMI